MNPVLSQREQEIQAVELTPEEIERAIWGAKITKWNYEKNKEYWQELEGRKVETGQTGLRTKTSGKVANDEKGQCQ